MKFSFVRFGECFERRSEANKLLCDPKYWSDVEDIDLF